MATQKATSIQLKSSQRASVQRQLETGYYENASEVIDDALRALDERRAVYDDFLRAKVKTAFASKRPAVPIDEAFEQARQAIARKSRVVARGA